MAGTSISHMEETVLVETLEDARQAWMLADAQLREGKLLCMKQREEFGLLFVKRGRNKVLLSTLAIAN